MKIAEEYFRRLLYDSKPMEAVFVLSSFWSVRGVESKPFFGLAEPEFFTQLFLSYQGDVGNGGHAQFFLNPVGKYSADVAKALNEIGLFEIAGIFQRACAMFPDGKVPAESAHRMSAIEHLDKYALEHWSELDREFYSVDSSSWQKVLDYLKKHENEILLLERSLKV